MSEQIKESNDAEQESIVVTKTVTASDVKRILSKIKELKDELVLIQEKLKDQYEETKKELKLGLYEVTKQVCELDKLLPKVTKKRTQERLLKRKTFSESLVKKDNNVLEKYIQESEPVSKRLRKLKTMANDEDYVYSERQYIRFESPMSQLLSRVGPRNTFYGNSEKFPFITQEQMEKLKEQS